MKTINDLIKELKGTDISCLKLGNVCDIKLGKQLTKNMLTDNGIPVISSGELPLGYTNEYNFDSPCITIS